MKLAATSHRPAAPNREANKADRTGSWVPERKEFRPRVPVMDRVCAVGLQVNQKFQHRQDVVDRLLRCVMRHWSPKKTSLHRDHPASLRQSKDRQTSGPEGSIGQPLSERQVTVRAPVT